MKHLIIIFVSIFGLSACSIFQHNRTLTEIEIRLEDNQEVNYGNTINYDIYAIYSNGKEKKINKEEELSLQVSGAKYNQKQGKIYLPSYPTEFLSDSIYISAEYHHNGVTKTDSTFIVYNYKGSTYLYFNGTKGTQGGAGRDGKTPLLFRDGTDGMGGEAGVQGGKGHDLTVYIWKEKETYFIKIIDLTADTTYFYKANQMSTVFAIFSNGGQGGQGGSGGDGGNGKDGLVSSSKTRVPGDGGNGGNGGQGGVGGQGGNIYVFIHPYAVDFQPKLKLTNEGGNPGAGGNLGKAGQGGKAATGQTAGSPGVDGVKGSAGYQGPAGDIINVEVMAFDIETEKNN